MSENAEIQRGDWNTFRLRLEAVAPMCEAWHNTLRRTEAETLSEFADTLGHYQRWEVRNMLRSLTRTLANRNQLCNKVFWWVLRDSDKGCFTKQQKRVYVDVVRLALGYEPLYLAPMASQPSMYTFPGKAPR